MTSHKAAALNALGRVETMLAQPEFNSLDRKLARATLEHVREQIEAIQEIKRVRKAKGAP